MQALVAEIEAALRDAERRAAELTAGSGEQLRARELAERLARLYEEISSSGTTLSVEAARTVFNELHGEASA